MPKKLPQSHRHGDQIWIRSSCPAPLRHPQGDMGWVTICNIARWRSNVPGRIRNITQTRQMTLQMLMMKRVLTIMKTKKTTRQICSFPPTPPRKATTNERNSTSMYQIWTLGEKINTRTKNFQCSKETCCFINSQ